MLSTHPAPGAVPTLSEPQTPRLAAERPAIEVHLDFARALFADLRIAAALWPRHLGGARSASQTEAVFERDLAHWERHGFGQWWWREHQSGELVARGGLQWTMVGGEAAVEVGWAVLPERWNEGLATELAAASIAAGFEELCLDSIVAYTLVTNAPSRRVMEKVGLAYERRVRHLDLPHVLYRLSAGEWRVLARGHDQPASST